MPVPVPARSTDDPPPIDDDAAPTVATVAGYSHNLGLADAGDVLAWEDRPYGPADDPDVIRRRTPTPVPGMDDGTVAAVAAGFSHSFALSVDGTVLAWGSKFFGQLGDGTTANRTSDDHCLLLQSTRTPRAGWSSATSAGCTTGLTVRA